MVPSHKEEGVFIIIIIAGSSRSSIFIHCLVSLYQNSSYHDLAFIVEDLHLRRVPAKFC